MRLTVLGGGGFRVPLVYRALLEDAPVLGRDGAPVELVLHDTDPARLKVVLSVLERVAAARPGPAPVSFRAAVDLDDALRGADFVFSAIRVGGTDGRVGDERAPLAEGVLGQETVGAGGVLYGLRTVPVATAIAERVAALAPEAWVINFTNPAGTVTEAMSRVLGDRVIGICDSPVGLCRRAARALGADPDRAMYDYVGLNHLGWLRRLVVDGRDRLPELLADDEALASFEEGRLFGAGFLRVLGALPNEYLHYYYFRREALAAVRASETTRGEFLRDQQEAFFSAAAERPDQAYELWEHTRLEREETYLAEARAASGSWERDASDLEGGGYDRVAMALMRAIRNDERTTLVLNVRNRSAVPFLDADAVVETVCTVGAGGAVPLAAGPVREDQAGLMLSLKAVERATIEAATTGSRAAAVRALALHPLVDSAAAAARILDRSRP
ncbi:6-phospho-beta-glucosidase [Streptomyces sp. SCUT-3]|uniref:6-phospho-beta-glucosidase n=1 Tax=Streptomyces sp. SCUT-3 TaxID=2684469 RepID=UPI0015F97E49|nr:6-phospho-beta-glucosidase [Streptomyces sp. SCUT-3]QMV23522.1 6-phospho-beta-glucosidase [Streptomyces sp. SCUT-3]